MGSGGLGWYQWKKHGRCAGLDPADYFALARRAYRALTLPEPAPRATAAAIEAAILDANPALAPDATIVTCGNGRLQEVRICLTRDLAPRPCGRDVAQDACRTPGPLDVPPVP
jgi:ribonuclease T2